MLYWFKALLLLFENLVSDVSDWEAILNLKLPAFESSSTSVYEW
jgi:hypothetical protein